VEVDMAAAVVDETGMVAAVDTVEDMVGTVVVTVPAPLAEDMMIVARAMAMGTVVVIGMKTARGRIVVVVVVVVVMITGGVMTTIGRGEIGQSLAIYKILDRRLIPSSPATDDRTTIGILENIELHTGSRIIFGRLENVTLPLCSQKVLYEPSLSLQHTIDAII
jgi:hypothetical protein